MIGERKGRTYNERLEIKGLNTLEARRSRADMLEVLKITHGLEGLQENTFLKWQRE